MKFIISQKSLVLLVTLVQLPAFSSALQAAENPREAAAPERMARWREMRYGLFIHWGPYSKLGGSYGEKKITGNPAWAMRSAAISREDYLKLAKESDPANYNPTDLVSFAKESGFKYLILCAKGPDGFALFDSKHSEFDSVDTLRSKRDMAKEFADACETSKMPFGFYYSIDADWYHPGGQLYGRPWDKTQSGKRDDYLEKVALPQVKELLGNHKAASQIIFDQSRTVPPDLATLFRAELRPAIVSSQSFDAKTMVDYHHTGGGSLGPNLSRADWETSSSINEPAGKEGSPGIKSEESIIRELVTTASQGGNFLLDVELDAAGELPAQTRERLTGIARWLRVNGASIYGTGRSPFTVIPWEGGATVRDNGDNGSTLYIHLFKPSGESLLLKNLLTKPLQVRLMGTDTDIVVGGMAGAWTLDMSAVPLTGIVPVIEIRLPSKPAMGRGPIQRDLAGNFPLDISRATYAGKNEVDRTQSSSDLQVTGFAAEGDGGQWEVFSEDPVQLSLSLVASTESVNPEKKLALSLNGREIERIGSNDTDGPVTDTTRFISQTFQLPSGSNRIGIFGTADDEGPSPLTVLGIELIKN